MQRRKKPGTKKLQLTEQARLEQLIYRTAFGDETISQVGQDLGISRSRAHAILQKARDDGVVETKLIVNGPKGDNEELSEQVEQEWAAYGIDKVLVLNTLGNDERVFNAPAYVHHVSEGLAELTSRYVGRLPRLREGDQFCVSGGPLLHAFAQSFHAPVPGLLGRPLAVRGEWRAYWEDDVGRVLDEFRQKGGLWELSVINPQVLPGPINRQLIATRPELDACFGKDALQPVFCVSEVGGLYPKPMMPERFPNPYIAAYANQLHYEDLLNGRDTQTSPMRMIHNLGRMYDELEPGYYTRAWEAAEEKGVVAVWIWYGVDDEGELVPNVTETHALAVIPDDLRAWMARGTRSILMAYGSVSAHAIAAALRARLFNTIIIDTALAVQLIPRKRTPTDYANVPKQLVDFSGIETHSG